MEEKSIQNYLTTTYAALPLWQWLCIGFAVLIVLILMLFRLKKKPLVNESDVLDDAEMEAVLAKINALESEDNLAHSDALGDEETLNAELDDALADLGGKHHAAKPQADKPAIQDVDYDDGTNDLEDHIPQEADAHDISVGVEDIPGDPDAFFSEDDDWSAPATAADVDAIQDDTAFDFFASDEEHASAANPEAFEQVNAESDSSAAHPTASTEKAQLEDENTVSLDVDGVDFFALDDDADAGTDQVLLDESAITSVKTDDEFDLNLDLDDLFIDDGDEDAPSNEPAAADVQDKPVAVSAAVKPAPTQPRQTAEPTSPSLAHDAPVSDETKPSSAQQSKVKKQQTPADLEEMDINLDLASSFIVTGHGDRAIPWLEEVLQVGTEEQKARAQELMDQVRGA